MASSKSPAVQPFFDARGRLLIERRGLPRALGSTLQTDAYHFIRTASWTRVTLLFATLFVVVNLVFAVIYWIGDAKVTNSDGVFDYVWFSVQTLATIGYGYLAPDGVFANVVVTIESFVGIALTAVVTGVVFSRFATPSARVIFSNVAIIGDHDGRPTLMFRMANARDTAIVEATAHVYLSRDEVLRTGEKIRRIHDLALRRNNSPIFNLSWIAYHPIDLTSPLHGATADSLRDSNANVIVTFQGIDDQLAATVHTRWAYNVEDILFGVRFADVIHKDPETGVRYLDFAAFHTTEPLAATSSAGPDGPG